jgi:hypothetical protein
VVSPKVTTLPPDDSVHEAVELVLAHRRISEQKFGCPNSRNNAADGKESAHGFQGP